MGWSFHLCSGVVGTPNDSSAVGLIFFCALPNPKSRYIELEREEMKSATCGMKAVVVYFQGSYFHELPKEG